MKSLKQFITLTNAGGLKIETVVLNKRQIVSVQKPQNNKFGSIISMVNGEKFPVKESFNCVIEMLKE